MNIPADTTALKNLIANANACIGNLSTIVTEANAVLADLVATPPPAPPAFPLPPIAAPSGWKMIFGDHFTSQPTTPMYVETMWGKTSFPPELETYTPANVTVANSILSLTAKKDASGKITSGQLSTGGDLAAGGKNPVGFSFLYGYVEVRAQVPTGKGFWPACLWLMPVPNSSNQYQDHWEIDVMECINDAPGRYYATLHNGDAQSQVVVNTGTDITAGFHTYGADWQPGKIDWYFDGKLVGTTSDSSTVKVPSTVPMYLIMDLAVGGSWPPAPDASTPWPGVLGIDYLTVFQRQ